MDKVEVYQNWGEITRATENKEYSDEVRRDM